MSSKDNPGGESEEEVVLGVIKGERRHQRQWNRPQQEVTSLQTATLVYQPVRNQNAFV